MPGVRHTEFYTVSDAEDHIGDLRGNLDRLSEVHAFDQTDVVPITDAGSHQMYANDNNNTMSVVYASGATGNLPWSKLATFPDTAFTAATYTTICSATYPGGDAVAGSVYELDVMGTGTQGTLGNRQTLAFRIQMGGNNLQAGTFGTTAFFDGNSITFGFHVVGRVACVTPGGSANWKSFLRAAVSASSQNVAPGNADTAILIDCDGASGTTIDSTVDQTINIQAQWGATTGTPSGTSRIKFFRRIA